MTLWSQSRKTLIFDILGICVLLVLLLVDRIKTVLPCSHIDISFQEISEKSVEPVLMLVKGLNGLISFVIFWVGYKHPLQCEIKF